MLLPGISGFTLLLILGIYVPTISAVKELMNFHMQYLPGILALAVGARLALFLHRNLPARPLKIASADDLFNPWSDAGITVRNPYGANNIK